MIGTSTSVPVLAPVSVSVATPGGRAGSTTSTDALPVVSNPGSAAWAALSSGNVPSVVAPSLTTTSVSLTSKALVIDQDDTLNST